MLDPSYLSSSLATYVTFVDRGKHAVDFSAGLKHTFDDPQQMHGAETNAPGGLGVMLRVQREVWGGGGRQTMRIWGLRNVFKVNEPEMVESPQTEDNLLGVSVL